MAEKQYAPQTEAEQPQTVQFHYLKSTAYRVIYAEGVIGSLTPHGKIFVSLYNERSAIPRSQTHKVTPAGLGDIIETESRAGFVREMEAGVILDLDAAMMLRAWLDDRIRELQEVHAALATNIASGKGS